MPALLRTLALAALLGACSATLEHPEDAHRYTKLIPMPNGFRYIAAVDARYPEDSEQAEESRLAWLDRLRTEWDLCEGGYVMTERRPDRGRTPINGSLDHIYYTGVCQ